MEPRGTAVRLAELRTAVEALPLHQLRPVADPVFGEALPPTASPLARLPSQVALAAAALTKALHEQAGPPTWPVVNTPGIQAQVDAAAAKRGRPAAVQPHQVVRLARFVRLGDSLRVAAKKAGLKLSTAHRVLSGQHEVAHHPAVTATGLSLPPLDAFQKRSTNRQRLDTAAQATHVATGGSKGAAPPISGSTPKPTSQGVPA
jgi:hypothetical protein